MILVYIGIVSASFGMLYVGDTIGASASLGTIMVNVGDAPNRCNVGGATLDN